MLHMLHDVAAAAAAAAAAMLLAPCNIPACMLVHQLSDNNIMCCEEDVLQCGIPEWDALLGFGS